MESIFNTRIKPLPDKLIYLTTPDSVSDTMSKRYKNDSALDFETYEDDPLTYESIHTLEDIEQIDSETLEELHKLPSLDDYDYEDEIEQDRFYGDLD